MSTQEAPQSVIHRIETFTILDKGMRMERLSRIDDPNDCVYIGFANLMSPNAPPMPIRFKIDASSVEDAFSKFDGEARKAADEFNKQMLAQQNVIVPASSMPPPRPGGPLRGPGGNVIPMPRRT